MDAKPPALPPGWEARLGLNGRIYYYSNHSRTVQILPPPEVWRCSHSLPYGWEIGIDYDSKNYYINHLTQSVTYEDPRTEDDQLTPADLRPEISVNPVPRRYEIVRDKQLGFGFIAGSEKPVVIRSVTPGGPSDGKLLRDDQVVKIDSENVMMADREHVIELIRGKTESVNFTVLQPNRSANSSFLKPGKKIARSMDRPKVRFADDIIVNGQEKAEGSSPLLISPGVLRIYLENSQIKSFQFLPDTTAGDAVSALCEKLSFKEPNLFSLVLTPHDEVEQPIADNKSRKSSSRSSASNDLSLTSSSSPDSILVAPWDCLAKVVNNPSMRHHSCHFRLEFMPKDFHKLARDDPEAFRYLYQQCVNDVVSGDVYSDDLTRDELLKLASIQMQEFIQGALMVSPTPDRPAPEKQRTLSDSSSQRKFRFPSINNKISLKYIEKEYGLRSFLPPSVITSMQQDNTVSRYVRKTIQQHLKTFTNTPSMFVPYPTSPIIPTSPLSSPGPSTESTLLQLRMQYLKILSPQHLFGGRYFAASLQAIMESDITVLIGHHYGISQMINSKTKMVSVLAEFQHITGFSVAPCPAGSNSTTVTIEFEDMKPLILSMEPQSAHNMAFMAAGYCRVYGNVEMVLTLPLSESTTVPLYFGPHKVKPSCWNYPPISTFRASSSGVTIPSDITSPSYFYCDFSEPVTPAVLSQDSPRLDLTKTNGHHNGAPAANGHPCGKNGKIEGEYEALDIMSAPPSGKDKLEASDSNNNNSLCDVEEDATYEEIVNNYSLPESPVSSLSTGPYSDPSPSHSPRFESHFSRKRTEDLPTSEGYLVPMTSGQHTMEVSVQVEHRSESPVRGDDEKDWNDLMTALETDRPEVDRVPEVPDFLPSPPESLMDDNEEENVQNVIVPPPSVVDPNEKKLGDELESIEGRRSHSALSGSSTGSGLGEELNGSDGIRHQQRMSSFKPTNSELKVFTRIDNDVTSSLTATSMSSMTGSQSSWTPANKALSSTGIEEVQDPDTRRKLQETEDLIKYFREKREQLVGTPDREEVAMSRLGKADAAADDSGSLNYATDGFSSEIEMPIVTSDIASGNKRLRKLEKAANKNRKSWAGDETLTRKLSADDNRPLSMSNPDLAASSIRKKRSKGFFRRVFGDRKNRTLSMYGTSGSGADNSGTLDLALGSRRKKSGRRFRFPTPRIRLRRAFTLNSYSRKDNRNSVIPTTDVTSPKSRRFRFRPFSKKRKSHGILVISEPCSNVRGVDLLPSGKYTVAGTMFQGSATEAEVITVDNDSKRASQENLAGETAAAEVAESTVSPQNGKTGNADEASNEVDVKLRETSPSESQRPVSFSTFHQPIPRAYDGLIDDAASRMPFIAERRRKAESPTKSPRSTRLSQTSLPESSLGSNSTFNLAKPDELRPDSTEVPVSPSEMLKRQRALTLPADISSVDSLDNEVIPGIKMIRPVKPTRKLVPASNPTIPLEVPKSKSLPPNISSTEPTATSTPVPQPQRPVVRRKSSKKRRAPPPPISILSEEKLPENIESQMGKAPTEVEISAISGNCQLPAGQDRKSDWEDDAFPVSPTTSNEHSLVSEIFSYLEKSNVNEQGVNPDPAEKSDLETEVPLPYDEEYVMPGIKPKEVEKVEKIESTSEDETTERQQQAMFQMFYDEMIAESKLTLGSQDDVIDGNDDIIKTKQDGGGAGADVKSEFQNDAGVQASLDVIRCSGSDVSSENNDVSKYGVTQSPEVYIYYGREENGRVSEKDLPTKETEAMKSEKMEEHNEINVQNEMTETTESNSQEIENSTQSDCNDDSSVSYGESSSEYSVNTVQSSDFSPKHLREPPYYTYQNLITPAAYDKTISRYPSLVRRSSSTTKPPLPPKPIFH